MSNFKYNVIRNISDLSLGAERRNLIGGNLLFMTLNAKLAPPEGFVPQISRDTLKGIRPYLQRNPPQLYVYVHPDLIQYPKCLFAFCLDAYLNWGLKQGKGITALIGGIENQNDDFNVDVLIFESGQLIEVYDREMPGTDSRRFEAGSQSVVNEIIQKYPSAKVCQSAPLSNWNIEHVQYIENTAIDRLAYKSISGGSSAKATYLYPALIGVASVGIFGALITFDWIHYQDSTSRFHKAANDPIIKKQGGVDTFYINAMTQRRLFMESPRKQDILSRQTQHIIRAIGAIPNAQIVEIKLPGPPASNTTLSSRAPDVWMRISVPMSPGPAMTQLEEILTILSKSSGMDVGSAQQRWQDEQNRRIFTLEGFIHG